MTVMRLRPTLSVTLSALLGLTTPWTLAWLIGHLGSAEVLFAEQMVKHFPRTRPGVHPYLTVVVPCIDAMVCAAAFGVPLSIIAGGRFLMCWAAFMFGAVAMHLILSTFFTPAPFGGFAAGLSTLIWTPFWWLFALALLGLLFLAARSRMRLRYAA